MNETLRCFALAAAVATAAAGCRPLPPASLPDAPPAAGETAPALEIRELRPGVWLHTSYYTYPDGTRFPSNGLLVRAEDGLLLVDTAWGELLTVALLDRIEAELGLPVRRAVVTHFHHDRLAGADALEARGIEVFAHPRTPGLSVAVGTAVPDRTLGELTEPGGAVRVGPVEVFYPGPGHAEDNLLVWVPEQRVLFGGCAVRAAASASLGNLASADVAAWPEAIQRAIDRYPAAEVVVPGHGAAGGPELLEHTLALFGDRPAGAR